MPPSSESECCGGLEGVEDEVGGWTGVGWGGVGGDGAQRGANECHCNAVRGGAKNTY